MIRQVWCNAGNHWIDEDIVIRYNADIEDRYYYDVCPFHPECSVFRLDTIPSLRELEETPSLRELEETHRILMWLFLKEKGAYIYRVKE